MNPSAPLGLPPGSVRAILAILVLSTACACVVMQLAVPDWFIASVVGIVTNYFSGRGASEAHKTGARSSLEVINGA